MCLSRSLIGACLVCLLLSFPFLSPLAAQTVPTIAAASDLKFAVTDVAARFEKETGQKLKLVFGSSGNFKTQIMEGAPFELFMSADEGLVFELADAGRTVDRGRIYALGRIGIMVPARSPLKADGAFKDLAAALQDGRLKKFAIANPDHAPYGARAREALQHAGLWDGLQSKLVLGENIAQTTQFITSGSTQGGITALSLSLAPEVAKLGAFELIPESWHQPLRQRMVLIKDAQPSVRAFYEYIATPAAQQIMAHYGFVLPKE